MVHGGKGGTHWLTNWRAQISALDKSAASSIAAVWLAPALDAARGLVLLSSGLEVLTITLLDVKPLALMALAAQLDLLVN